MTNLVQVLHGPIFIGVILNVILYGIMIMQSYLYYTTYKKDPRWMKYLVLVVIVLDTANTVFDVMGEYSFSIDHFGFPGSGDSGQIVKIPWVYVADPLVTTLMAMVVQMFFAWRIYVLIQSRILVATVISFSIASTVGGLIVTHDISMIPSFLEFQKSRGVNILWLAGSAAADILITSILVWYLTGWKDSDMMIDRIIRGTVQTGFLTSTFALVDLILVLVLPKNGAHMTFNVVICKLYSNSLLSSLNSRRGQASTTQSLQVMSNFTFRTPRGTVEHSNNTDSISLAPQGPDLKVGGSSNPLRWEEGKGNSGIFVTVHSESRDV